MSSLDSAAFDAFAAEYDSTFTDSRLGRLIRLRVWTVLAQYFQPGAHVLELACGTGEDAVWLAHRGLQVTATDGSTQMVAQAQAKAEAAGLADHVTAVPLSFQQLIEGHAVEGRGAEEQGGRGQLSVPGRQSSVVCDQLLVNPSTHQPFTQSPTRFSGLFSNFGGLNTISNWADLARQLARLIEPGGKAVLVPMGPACPWEIGWHLLHGQVKTALRRFGQSAPAKIGASTIPIWYPSARRLKADFAPWFEHLETQSLGLWLPPSYLDHLVERWPNLFERLNRLEQATVKLTGGWGDHYIIVFERKSL